MKASVKRSQNDAADAAAICETVTRPAMRFMPVKAEEQQAAMAVHRARSLVICQRTQLTNELRAHLAELGIVAQTSREGLGQLIEIVANAQSSDTLPEEMICSAIRNHRYRFKAHATQSRTREKAVAIGLIRSNPTFKWQRHLLPNSIDP